ncbi:epidermal growth factor receptor kinase substrate 8-like protein 2 isoform X2 [Glossina fuscipes]|nr:epidermal growth factor receptor kinase substrate 8-like protein 2 isoform X2 [Glossina fuscipes]XP_037882171.1 epidermal growth factor receptor kinase substrate 8-like protein 2 isoform X2 [Glossina fuscipes]KAI9585407.1 hypothetical protein GQX74_001254 [Glossina fuscipes]
MSYHHHLNGGASSIGVDSGTQRSGGSGPPLHGEYSGDERESRSGGGDDRNDNSEIIIHNKPTYLLEHLATFTVNKDSGIVYPADGMRRLLQLEKTTGIWSQKMQLCLDHRWVLIMDYETGNIIEKFPASLIQEPTAFTSTDAMELYNNILVFIVSGGNGARSEMHIFQSQSVSAVHLVEDLKNLQRGNFVMPQTESISHNAHQGYKQTNNNNYADAAGVNKPMHSRSSDHNTRGHHYSQTLEKEHAYGGRNAAAIDSDLAGGVGGDTDSDHAGVGISLNDETSSVSSDKYERDVNVLNHCFDDIEKFIARLQHAAAASRELERRRRNRKSKKKDPGEGLLTLRTRPPHEKEFIDIFAKFKLSFNLLAKLKSHIHDPNAPELVHFLFTPLVLIVEAANDTYYESQLPTRVTNPLLTREAVNLLINCVTSKETELWRSLGDAWTVPRDQWKEDVGSYHPVFLDGWSPDYLIVDEHEPTTPPTLPIGVGNARSADSGRESTTVVPDSNNSTSLIHDAGGYDDYDGGSDKYISSHPAENIRRSPGVNTGDYLARSELNIESIERPSGLIEHQHQRNVNHQNQIGPNNQVQLITAGMQNLYTRNQQQRLATSTKQTQATTTEIMNSSTTGDDQKVEQWLDELQANGSKIVLVTYPRTANNDKELSVVHGEYLEILDDSRKWWKARNIHGQIAHVPHTIVTPFNYGDNDANRVEPFYNRHQTNSNYTSLKTGNNTHRLENVETPPPSGRPTSNDNTEWIRSKQMGKKGEFRYF